MGSLDHDTNLIHGMYRLGYLEGCVSGKWYTSDLAEILRYIARCHDTNTLALRGVICRLERKPNPLSSSA